MSDTFYKCEYENLRRKKNKEIERLERKLARGAATFYDYLVEKGLFQEFMVWMLEKKRNDQ